MNKIILFSIFVGASSFGALPNKNSKDAAKDFDNIVASTIEALKLPGDARIEVLAKMGPKAYKELMLVAFDPVYGMRVQWRALTAMAMIGKKNSIPEMERALEHKEWFLRNAGLLALNEIDRSKANNWAKRLLSDPSLIVRTEAVQVLQKNKDHSARPVLWEKLYDKQNFRGNQSLWIRRHIVETLAASKRPGEEKRFLKILDDRDMSLHPMAVSALEFLTKKHLGEPHDSVRQKTKLWKAHFAKNPVKI